MGEPLAALVDPLARLMVQVLKDEVRERIVTAALAVFAERGFRGATLALIGRRARVGAASVYRYYSSKSRLFAAAVPKSLVTELEALLERRVHALGAGPDAALDDGGDAMLRLWTEHRLAMVILLERAEGTPYAKFGERFVERLVALTTREIERGSPGAHLTPAARFVLRTIFENTRRTIAAILAAHSEPGEVREAVERFWSYQIPGLRGFARGLAEN